MSYKMYSESSTAPEMIPKPRVSCCSPRKFEFSKSSWFGASSASHQQSSAASLMHPEFSTRSTLPQLSASERPRCQVESTRSRWPWEIGDSSCPRTVLTLQQVVPSGIRFLRGCIRLLRLCLWFSISGRGRTRRACNIRSVSDVWWESSSLSREIVTTLMDRAFSPSQVRRMDNDWRQVVSAGCRHSKRHHGAVLNTSGSSTLRQSCATCRPCWWNRTSPAWNAEVSG